MAQMRVFVSHSHEDDAFCRTLVRELRRAGADVWYDEHNMASGQLIDSIEHELRIRPVFVVILSPAALRSQWVRDESKWAYARFKRDPNRIILPVLAAPLPDEDAIWLFLQDFKRIEAPNVQPFPTEEAVRRTLRALALTPAGEPPAPAAPQPSESTDELIVRGRAYWAQGKYVSALALFRLATERAPGSFDAWHMVGRTLTVLKRYDEALPALVQALSLDPNSAYAWNIKGHVLHGLEREEEALVAFQKAASLVDESDFPLNEYFIQDLADQYRVMGNLTQAKIQEDYIDAMHR